MAEAFVSVLLEQLASIAYQQIEKEVRLVVGVKKEVAKITSNLKSIQAVLEDADKRQFKEAIVRDWLEKLKDVSYEIDDVLDEWSTEILIQQADDHHQEAESSTAATSVTKKKVCFFVPSTCFSFGQVNRVIHRRDIAVRIQDLSDRLDEIARERQKYDFQNTERVFEQLERFETSSFVDISKTFGREDETKVVIDKLVGESSQEARNLLVISIVGMGGMGKTTLAQMVYNDEKVKSAFTKTIWVCVSDPFDEIKIAKAIIEPLNVAAPNSNDLQPLLECIHENVRGQKFLLVLDDVWNEDYRKWELLKLSLQNGIVGSRILVTTRKEKVAEVMGSTTANMIHLGKLSEECCWSIFYYYALDEREINESRELESLGKQIVKRCRGLPLAAKVFGGLMRFKKTKGEWAAVLETKTWELDLVKQDIFQPLLLSYYDLTPMIKRCLLYCVIFPTDHVIDKQTLIELWMSQGYLSSVGNIENTIIGQWYFEDLVKRFFFQDFEKDEEGNIRSCRMHGIVHDFLQFLTRGEFVTLDKGSLYYSKKKKGSQSEREFSKIRHLTLNCASQELSHEISNATNHLKDLRTITTLDSDHSTLDLDLISQQLRCLRTLTLNCGHIHEVPTSISSLVHLRYICLSHNQTFKELPDTMCNLYNLQTLHLISLEQLEKLPEGMDKLGSLRNLHVTGCTKLVYLPEVIGKLVSLRYIDLSDNPSLINLPNGLCDLNNLQNLHLSRCDHIEELPEAIGQLSNLKHLRVDGCHGLKYLPEGIGKLKELRYLDLSQNHFLTELPEFICTLYSLQTLRLNGCKQLVGLPEAIGKLIDLMHLHAARCDQLQNLPDGIGKLVQLREIDLSHSKSLEKLPSTMHNLPYLQTLRLQGCPKLNVNVAELIKYEAHELELEFLQEAIGRLKRLLTPLGCDVSSDENFEVSIKRLGK